MKRLTALISALTLIFVMLMSVNAYAEATTAVIICGDDYTIVYDEHNNPVDEATPGMTLYAKLKPDAKAPDGKRFTGDMYVNGLLLGAAMGNEFVINDTDIGKEFVVTAGLEDAPQMTGDNKDNTAPANDVQAKNNQQQNANPSDVVPTAVIPPDTQTKSASQNIKLTLKKVKVRKSAKKLVLTAKLKINGNKAKKKKVTFKFNGKKYKVKTNKRGVAKVTIKKKVLKKLKVGKKVTYSVTYGNKTVKRTVKVKK